MTRVRLAVLLVVAMLVLGGCLPSLPAPHPPQPPPTTTTVPPLTDDRPLATVTPGVTFEATAAQVCTPGWAGKHRRSLTAAEKRQVLAAYGLRPDQPVGEWDHLVPLELGGANGTGNIWPQLSEDGRKDRLENRLHRLVCAGRLDLALAQERARQFWRYW